MALILLMIMPQISFAQTKAKDRKVEITLKVVNEANEAVPGASVIIGEGLLYATTDINGEYTFKAKPSAAVTVKMVGYEEYHGFVAPLSKDSQIILKEAKFLASNADIVNVPFDTTYRRYTTDNVYTISGEELLKYPTSDLRNALVGLLPGFFSTEKDGQPGISIEETTGKYGIEEKVSESTRGQGITYIVDDIQIDITELSLDPEEVESLTLIKDPVNKALYGPMATNGVIYIKTKRGKANERRINVNMEAGVSVVDRFPEYVNGADYAKLNNIARINSGREPLYSENAIKMYANNDPNNMLYPSVNFRDLLFKNTRNYQRVNVSSYGGNDIVQYSAYVGYTGEGDIYKIGRTADYHRLNVRANLDLNLNKFMKLRFDFAGNLNIRRSPNYNNGSGENINEFNSVLSHANTISPIAFPVYTGIDKETGHMSYGTSNLFSNNPVGGLEANGFYTDMNRSGMGGVALDISLGSLLKGLKSTTYVGFNGAYLTRIGKSEEYATFMVIPNDFSDLGYDLQKVKSEELASENSKLHDYYSLRYTLYERLSYDNKFGKNMLSSGITAYTNVLTRDEYTEPLRQANGIFDATYVYDDKYVLQGVVDYAGSNYYAEKNRYKFFPAFGAAWIASEEGFMKNIKCIDFFKIRAQVAKLGNMQYKQTYKYQSDWSSNVTTEFGHPGGTHSTWLGTNHLSGNSTTYTVSGNPELDWEYFNEFTVGAEMMLFKKRLTLDVAYYDRTREGIIEQVENVYPDYCGFATLPFVNYGKTRYRGFEFLASYKDVIGGLAYKITAMGATGSGENIIVDEPDYADNEKWYRSKVGHPVGGIYGLVYEGRYEYDIDAKNDPVKSSYSSDLKKGDLKYRDMNGDGIINGNDFAYIGNSTPKFQYSINLNLAYKGFEFTAVANGVAGRQGLITNNYYRNGNGDNNYSVWVRDNYTTNERMGEYPRLTYDKVDHNFQNSAFWIRNTSFFKLQNIELAYNLPAKFCDSIGFGGIRVFLRGANLLTISPIKDTDPESMDAGVTKYPLYSTYVGGLKLTF